MSQSSENVKTNTTRKSPYSALYGPFEEPKITTEQANPIQIEITSKDTNTSFVHTPHVDKKIASPEPEPSKNIPITPIPTNTPIQPFSNILPTVNQFNQNIIQNQTLNTNASPYSAITALNASEDQARADLLKKRRLVHQFHSLVRRNYEILPAQYRTRYKSIYYMSTMSLMGVFVYFFMQNRTGEGLSFRKIGLRFFGMYIVLTWVFGHYEDKVVSSAFDSMYSGMNFESIEKSLEQHKESVPLLKL